ncbi:chaperone TorD involved in molybdoenzyme TorA maturation [Tistlia consotensis]|uniref:Chaperone TorD involved in molybdoenzyme TorA maturation n=1 Tax=Tistlia consotensis USBA 355 TaxID=560819 RepID=A0A1Y6BQK3_9PROT|nr:molecular chaperone TorD family protein [Tistlia consotensis]SMF23851.1 chaperone TorD involved in molybdoenzyme TorA maturation [Tistlia consotensis USBA 355]SNR61183.1 chaperone TorD involved in molybdoenzyme TorA maturation [Tistlia consotensis]
MAEDAIAVDLTEEDALRVQWYALLAKLLGAPADRETLSALGGLKGTEGELGQAVSALAAAARASDPKTVEQEYFELFVGVGHGELVPFASYYLTGFLHEKPLARLRGDMRLLGIAREESVKEPEDHIAALCEMMAGLISGSFGRPADLAEQRRFFDTHVGCWAPRFFEDLQAARAARFYMPVGTIGRLFLAIESQAFEMAA